MFKRLCIIFTTILFFTLAKTALAVENPLSSANNKFGIHISSENDLDKASELINSGGGDYGYVTFVITEQERDHDRWQKAFDKMRSLHIIPIVRIATKSNDNGTWDKPKSEEINNWIAFLNSLNWVIKNRYVVIYNEPNHAKEWGGEVNPKEYAQILKEFSKKLKEANENFFVIPAGLDASAPNSKETMDEALFIKEMFNEQDNLFDHIDGLSSHSYPNPDFSGSEKDSGRQSLKTFEWEIAEIGKYVKDRNLPVFITETGWKHSVGKPKSPYLDPSQLTAKFSYAFENVWSSDKVVAVTPFILNYKTPPFDSFSWVKPDGSNYDFFEGVKHIKKTRGEPVRENRGLIYAVFVSPIQKSGSVFSGAALVRNIGQTIWEGSDVGIETPNSKISILNSFLYGPIQPYSYGMITFSALTPINAGSYDIKFNLSVGNKEISNEFPYKIFSVSGKEMQNKSIFDRIVEYLSSIFSLFGPIAQR